MSKRKFGTVMDTQSKVQFKRTFEHVDGNWPTFVYIPISLICQRELQKIFNCCIHHFLDTKLAEFHNTEVEQNCHISLSKTFTLRYHQIEAFIESLENALNFKIKFIVDILSKYYFLQNEDESRAFMCVHVEDVSKKLVDLIKCVDDCLTKFNKQDHIYYSQPKFHVSILSLLPSQDSATNNYFNPSKTYNVGFNYSSEKTIPQYFLNQDGDSDDSDDDLNFSKHLKKFSSNTIDDTKEIIPNKNEYMCSKIGININFIECKVGDRIFRLKLRNDSTDATSKFIQLSG